MDWLFRSLGRFFEWVFIGIEWLGLTFDYILIAIGLVLMLGWIIAMRKYGENDKGRIVKNSEQ